MAKVPLETIVTTQIGDLLGFPKSLITNLVVKRVKKMVPAFSLPGAVPFKQALSSGARHTLKDVSLNHDDLAFLQYTGGTTGVAKGAMLSHGNMVANIYQFERWMHMERGREIFLAGFPIFHQAGLFVSSCAMAWAGTQILIPDPRKTEHIIQEYEQYLPTFLKRIIIRKMCFFEFH